MLHLERKASSFTATSDGGRHLYRTGGALAVTGPRRWIALSGEMQ